MDIKLLSYRSGQGPKAGLLAGDDIIDVQGSIPGIDTSSVLSILHAWPEVLSRLDAIAAKPAKSMPLASVKLTAPILYSHLEKLNNLEALPSDGFEVVCFPVKVHRASAGWARAVAILPN